MTFLMRSGSVRFILKGNEKFDWSNGPNKSSLQQPKQKAYLKNKCQGIICCMTVVKVVLTTVVERTFIRVWVCVSGLIFTIISFSIITLAFIHSLTNSFIYIYICNCILSCTHTYICIYTHVQWMAKETVHYG